MVRAASSISCNCRAAGGKLGLTKTPTSGTPGTSSRSKPSRFGSNGRRRSFGCKCRWLSAGGRQHRHAPVHQFSRHCRKEVVLTARPAELNDDVLALDVAALSQAVTECGDEMCGVLR